MTLNGHTVCITCAPNTLAWNDKQIRLDYVLNSELGIGKDSVFYVDVHYIEEEDKRILRNNVVRFCGTEEKCDALHSEIQQHLQDVKRPKRLLVVINPDSGKRKGEKVYKKYAAPLFKMCNIQTHIVVTPRPSEMREMLMSMDLSEIDGIVVVGGDGWYCECMTGLILAEQEKAGINTDDTESILRQCPVPVGIIPAGSGDVIVQYLHGTRDVTTAILRIILGSTVPTNSVSLHEGGKLISYSGLVLGFGLFGDMMFDCEQFRWMGPSRYEVIPVKTMFTKRRVVDVEVEYLPADDSQKIDRSALFERQLSCPVKRHSEIQKRHRIKSTPDLDLLRNDWKKTDGKVYAVDTHPISMKESSGIMTPRFGEEEMNLILTDKCSLMKHMNQLMMVKDKKPECYDFDFVRKIPVKGYRVKLPSTPITTDKVSGEKCLAKSYYINCDGNFIKLKQPQFEVRLHSKVMKLFGTVVD